MDKIYTIYGYYQPAENKWYVGKTVRPLHRRAWGNGKGYFYNEPFKNDILKYGWPSFEPHILDTTTDKEEAYRLEQYWIEQKNSIYPNGYNIEGGGLKGKIVTSSTKEKNREAHLGKKATFETKRKMSEKRKGHLVSIETKNKQSFSNRNNPKQDCHPVQRFTLDGQFIAEYPSQKEAERQTGVFAASIQRVCVGKQKTAGGSIWKYA